MLNFQARYKIMHRTGNLWVGQVFARYRPRPGGRCHSPASASLPFPHKCSPGSFVWQDDEVQATRTYLSGLVSRLENAGLQPNIQR